MMVDHIFMVNHIIIFSNPGTSGGIPENVPLFAPGYIVASDSHGLMNYKGIDEHIQVIPISTCKVLLNFFKFYTISNNSAKISSICITKYCDVPHIKY